MIYSALSMCGPCASEQLRDGLCSLKPPVWWGNRVGSRQWLYKARRGEIKNTKGIPWLGLRSSRKASWLTTRERLKFWKMRRSHSGKKRCWSTIPPRELTLSLPGGESHVLPSTQRHDNWAGSCWMSWNFLVRIVVRKVLKQVWESQMWLKTLEYNVSGVWQAEVAEQSAGRYCFMLITPTFHVTFRRHKWSSMDWIILQQNDYITHNILLPGKYINWIVTTY